MCFAHPFDVFRCGKCPECLQDKRREWSVRLQLHTLYSNEKPFFCHLTYDNNHVPVSDTGMLTLSKRDAQLFLKRLRSYLNETKIKYYCAGEYGPNATHRPHFHCIIFGLNKSFTEDEAYLLVQKAWQNGEVRKTSKYLRSFAQLHYATKYMINFDSQNFDGKMKPFRLASSGLGQPFIEYAKNHDLFNKKIQAKFKCKYSVRNGIKIPVFWYDEKPLIYDSQLGELIVNPILDNFRDFIELTHFIDGKMKTKRYPLPRYFQQQLYTDDFRTALAVVKKYKMQLKTMEYHSEYLSYDSCLCLDIPPMWLQLKRYNWQHVKKNKKDKMLKDNNQLIL